MRRSIILFALAALVTPGFAKMGTVKGAKCTECHVGKPTDKKFTKAAGDMLAKHKEATCKDCHGAADGKLTTTDAAKKAAKK